MHWKIARDPYFAPLAELLGEDQLEGAGFFFDTATHEHPVLDHLDIPCTPLAHVRAQLASFPSRRPAVVVGTGSFNPVHEGHLAMMRAARDAVNAAGYQCVGGFLTPDHDEYLQLKLGAQARPFHERVRLLADATKFEPWLNVDPWAGILRRNSVTYTDIVLRLTHYLQFHLNATVDVFYVCGGDNAHYAQAFTHHGNAVMVSRPGYETHFAQSVARVRELQRAFDQGDQSQSVILTAHSDNDASSTKLRPSFQYPARVKELILRVERPNEQSQMPFLALLTSRFAKTSLLLLSDQQQQYKTYLKPNLISLDPLLPGPYNLGVSRLYDAGGMRFLGFTNRPGTPPLEGVHWHIPAGEYELFDDDVQGGATFAFTKELLAQHEITVTAEHALSRTGPETEVLDLRDFILDAPDGGLVMQLPDGSKTRVPYVYPYVCPHYRASIDDPMRFSKEVWVANANYHYNVTQNFRAAKHAEQMLDLLNEMSPKA